MMRDRLIWRWALALAAAGGIVADGVAQTPANARELVAELAATRARGCGGPPANRPGLRWVGPLAQAAHSMARGSPAAAALKSAGYRARRVFRVQLGGYGSARAVARTMAEKYCEPLANASLTDVGIHQQGGSYWILLAEPFNPPPAAAAASVAHQVLVLTNQTRAQPRKCGNQLFEAAPPLKANAQLDQAAVAHAREMARRGVLQHEGGDGSTAGQRVSRAGYRWRNVGENIASGQDSVEQVMAEWTSSPEHCANLMDPRFTEMGLGYAVNLDSEGGIYWAQEFGRPRF